MRTLDPEIVDEVKRRVCIAWTMALTIKPHASKEEQLKLAEELLNKHTTDELVEQVLELRWVTPLWWKGTREQWIRQIGISKDEADKWILRS